MNKLAIDGGEPIRTLPFPSWPIWDKREEELLLQVLHSGRWGVLDGDKVHQFEARFAEFQALRRERDAALAQLSERKLVERAKGILMRRRGLPENAAYQTLRRMAMDRGKRLAEVAESVIVAEEMLVQG